MNIRIALIAVVILSLPIFAFAGGIEGVYDCKGAGPGGAGAYEGTVSIIENNDIYKVTWTLGSSVYLGTGFLINDTLSIGYSDSSKSWFGVIVYKVKGNKLKGKWITLGNEKAGSEMLTRRK